MHKKDEIVQSFHFLGGETGILLIHGFTASPIDLKPIGEIFHNWGYTVNAPLLTGHGTTPEEMKKTSWEDWLREADRTLEQMKNRCSQVIAVGHSMGGLLALALAAQHKLEGVVAINAPQVYRDPELHRAYNLLDKQDYVEKPNKSSELSTNREGLLHFSYIKVPVKCFVSLNHAIKFVHDELPNIQCPALIIQSLEDQTIHPTSGEIIYNGIGNQQKELLHWEDEDHYLPLSSARNEVGHRIKDFILKYELG